jgi:hypothetical protein
MSKSWFGFDIVTSVASATTASDNSKSTILDEPWSIPLRTHLLLQSFELAYLAVDKRPIPHRRFSRPIV